MRPLSYGGITVTVNLARFITAPQASGDIISNSHWFEKNQDRSIAIFGVGGPLTLNISII
jgi:hypothetical protein